MVRVGPVLAVLVTRLGGERESATNNPESNDCVEKETGDQCAVGVQHAQQVIRGQPWSRLDRDPKGVIRWHGRGNRPQRESDAIPGYGTGAAPESAAALPGWVTGTSRGAEPTSQLKRGNNRPNTSVGLRAQQRWHWGNRPRLRRSWRNATYREPFQIESKGCSRTLPMSVCREQL